MTEGADGGEKRPGPVWPAFGVHVLTASGAGLALLALLAAAQGRFVEMFGWLGAALLIDGIDGTLARRFKVADALPRWSGDTLDFVVDFATYVFVPAYAIAASGLLPDPAAAPIGILIVVTGAIYFADRKMKVDGSYFRGFPALWNAAAFYLFLIKPTPWIGAGLMFALAVATFLPFRVIHPFRVVQFRTANIVCLIVWSGLAIYALVMSLEPGLWVTTILTLLGLYVLLVGVLGRGRN